MKKILTIATATMMCAAGVIVFGSGSSEAGNPPPGWKWYIGPDFETTMTDYVLITPSCWPYTSSNSNMWASYWFNNMYVWHIIEEGDHYVKNVQYPTPGLCLIEISRWSVPSQTWVSYGGQKPGSAWDFKLYGNQSYMLHFDPESVYSRENGFVKCLPLNPNGYSRVPTTYTTNLNAGTWYYPGKPQTFNGPPPPDPPPPDPPDGQHSYQYAFERWVEGQLFNPDGVTPYTGTYTLISWNATTQGYQSFYSNVPGSNFCVSEREYTQYGLWWVIEWGEIISALPPGYYCLEGLHDMMGYYDEDFFDDRSYSIHDGYGICTGSPAMFRWYNAW